MNPPSDASEEHPVSDDAAGASIGSTVAGFVGAVIGGVIGAVTGFGGKAAAPETEASGELGWRESESMAPQRHEEVANRAWQYFEARGRTGGHDLDDWLRAEKDIKEGWRATGGR